MIRRKVRSIKDEGGLITNNLSLSIYFLRFSSKYHSLSFSKSFHKFSVFSDKLRTNFPK